MVRGTRQPFSTVESLDDSIRFVGVPVDRCHHRCDAQQEIEDRVGEEILNAELARQSVLGDDREEGVNETEDEKATRQEEIVERALPVHESTENDGGRDQDGDHPLEKCAIHGV